MYKTELRISDLTPADVVEARAHTYENVNLKELDMTVTNVCAELTREQQNEVLRKLHIQEPWTSAHLVFIIEKTQNMLRVLVLMAERVQSDKANINILVFRARCTTPGLFNKMISVMREGSKRHFFGKNRQVFHHRYFPRPYTADELAMIQKHLFQAIREHTLLREAIKAAGLNSDSLKLFTS